MNSIIGVYQDPKKTLILNPLAINAIGAASSTNKTFKLDLPYEPVVIGKIIDEGIAFCKENPYLNEELAGDLPLLTGYKNRGKFVKEHLHIIVSVRNDLEKIIFTPMKRSGTGYVNNGQFKVEVTIDSNNEEIGKALLQALEFCK